jgi:hypothetical protein
MFDFTVPLIGFVVVWALFRGIVVEEKPLDNFLICMDNF